MSGREILDISSDDSYDQPVSGEHFRGTVAGSIMSEAEARQLQAHFDAARHPNIISRAVNFIANAFAIRSEPIRDPERADSSNRCPLNGRAVVGARMDD